MSRRVLLALLVGLIAVASIPRSLTADEPTAKTEDVKIPAREGVELVAVAHRPAECNGVAVVIGSGRGYHKDLPLLVRTAEALQNAGFLAIRFDWAYFTAKDKHHPELETEVADLEAVIRYARAQEGIESLYLAGKSLGSVAALMRALAKPDDLDALLLLTLPLHAPGKPETLFPDMQRLQSEWTKPLMIVCGDRDPYSDLDVLYRYAAGFETPATLVTAPGDHSFRGPEKDEARTIENVDLAAHGITVWASRWQQGDG